MSKLVFFPWPSISASEHEKMKGWIASGDFSVAHYTGNKVNAVSGKVVGGQIYLFGHSAPGSDIIANDDNTSITYQVTGDRLAESGLSKMYSGAIKVYACNSGTPTTIGSSFAKKLAKYLYFDKKYIFLRVYGYNKMLTGHMTTHDGTVKDGVWNPSKTDKHKKAHKFAVQGDVDNYQLVKAKDERNYVSPFGG